MKAIAEMPEVIDDIAHQVVVGMQAFIERRDLPVQDLEQPAEVCMFFMPCLDRIDHGPLHVDSPAGMPAGITQRLVRGGTPVLTWINDSNRGSRKVLLICGCL